MNRLFGRGKPKEPPPNITDCIAGVRNMTNLLSEKQHTFLFVTLFLHYIMSFLVIISRKIYTTCAKQSMIYQTFYDLEEFCL